jgi:predicted ATPase/class 3 adenylate cyclase
VTFVFTDIVGSTAMLGRCGGSDYATALERHRELIRQAITPRGGHVVNIMGDGLFLVFADAVEAMLAIREAIVALENERWPQGEQLRIRAGAHSDDVQPTGWDYMSLSVHQAARVCAAANSSQLLITSATARAIGDRLPPWAQLQDLGRFVLRDFPAPEPLYQLAAAGMSTNHAPPRTARMSRHNLPVERTSFVGRIAEVQALRGEVARSPLVTVTGAGGVGKTRLALAVATGLLESFADGVWLIELAPQLDAPSVYEALARVLGVRLTEAADPLRELYEALVDRQMLVILDNCEHLLDTAADVADMLVTIPGVRVLATSREPLGVYGESVRRVPSLSEDEATELFWDRLNRGPADADEHDAVALLTAQLDQIPLAIELAAASAANLGTTEVAHRLGDRLHLLESRARGVLPRHRTLRALIEWSYDLLTDQERVLFRRLSVFAGGCSLDDAERTCAGELLPRDGVRTALTALVDKSLVQMTPTGGGARYTVLESLRLFGAEELDRAGETADAQRHHLRAMADFAAPIPDLIWNRDFEHWSARCRQEEPNILAALSWPLADDEARRLRVELLAGLAEYFILDSKASDALINLWRKAVDEGAGLTDPAWVTAAVGLVRYQTTRIPHAEGIALLKDVLNRTRQTACRASVRGWSKLATLYCEEQQTQEADAALRCAFELAAEVGDPQGDALLNIHAGWVDTAFGRFESARDHVVRAIDLAGRIGARRILIQAQGTLGWVHFISGRLDEAERAAVATLAESVAVGFVTGQQNGHLVLGHIRRRLGNLSSAFDHYVEALTLARSRDQTNDHAESIEGLVMVAVDTEQYQIAAQLVGAAARLRETTQRLEAALQGDYDGAQQSLDRTLAQEDLVELRTCGSALSEEELDQLVKQLREVVDPA